MKVNQIVGFVTMQTPMIIVGLFFGVGWGQMLRWVEPDTPYFKTNFQEPHARLNPGMTAAIVIFFRPESVEDYFSSIVFRTARVCCSSASSLSHFL